MKIKSIGLGRETGATRLLEVSELYFSFSVDHAIRKSLEIFLLLIWQRRTFYFDAIRNDIDFLREEEL